eukprot:tig00020921_g15921.t1
MSALRPVVSVEGLNGVLSEVVVLSTRGSAYFAERISDLLTSGGKDALHVIRGYVERKEFKGGEQYYRIRLPAQNPLSPRRSRTPGETDQDASEHIEKGSRVDLFGRTVVYVASTAEDSDLLELLRVGMELAALGTRRRIFVVPFLGYSTMERAVLSGEVVTAKANARLMSAIPHGSLGNVFLFMDLHVSGLLQYFEGPTVALELYGERPLCDGIRSLGLAPGSFMFGSADLGRPKWVQAFADLFKVDLALVRKSRSPDGEQTHVMEIIGNVTGKAVVIYDDMTRTGGSLINAAKAYLEKGASAVYAVLSHLALASPEHAALLERSPIARIVATNSHPATQWPEVRASPKFLIVDATPEFVKSLFRIVFQ